MNTIPVLLTIVMALPVQSLAQNNLGATPQPKTIGEAVGLYAGAVTYMQVLKSSPCGTLIKRPSPDLDQVIRHEILPLFPSSQKHEVAEVLSSLKQQMWHQGQATFETTYNYYSREEGLDHNTICGYMAGSGIALLKLTKEAMIHISKK